MVQDGDTEWFGCVFTALGVAVGLGGAAAMFLRISLVIDRPDDTVSA